MSISENTLLVAAWAIVIGVFAYFSSPYFGRNLLLVDDTIVNYQQR